MEELFADAATRLEVTDLEHVTRRGQKSVLKGLRHGETIALKLIVLDGSSSEPSEVVVARARREFEALDRTSNAHVVATRGELQELGSPITCIAWAEEFIEGADLAELFEVGPLDWSAVRRMAIDVGSGLQAFHAQGVVHRDLTPSNVRRREIGGSYVVLDPGYARFVDYTTITQAGQPGTLGYLSPEHLEGGRGPSVRSDLYSLGVLMFEALTGRLPTPVSSDTDHYAASLLGGDPPSVGSLRDDLSGCQIAIVDTCLRRQAARRYKNVDGLLTALQDCP